MRLTIRKIETIPIRVPLPRVYRGSYYQMTHRSTIVTRIHMDEGIMGEVFTGDEDHINSRIERVIQDEIAPRLIGEDDSLSSAAGNWRGPPHSIFSATAALPWWRAPR